MGTVEYGAHPVDGGKKWRPVITITGDFGILNYIADVEVDNIESVRTIAEASYLILSGHQISPYRHKDGQS